MLTKIATKIYDVGDNIDGMVTFMVQMTMMMIKMMAMMTMMMFTMMAMMNMNIDDSNNDDDNVMSIYMSG